MACARRAWRTDGEATWGLLAKEMDRLLVFHTGDARGSKDATGRRGEVQRPEGSPSLARWRRGLTYFSVIHARTHPRLALLSRSSHPFRFAFPSIASYFRPPRRGEETLHLLVKAVAPCYTQAAGIRYTG